MTTPTPEAIEALALELAKFHCPSADAALRNEYADARWILTRFVRREEHEQVRAWSKSFANENKELFAENSRLRAELRGQRCDGSGRLHGRASTPIAGVIGHVAGELGCYGCPACKPEAAPKGECECGHVREQHTQGCRMIGCDCPYYAPPDATPKGDGHEHLWISTSWGRPRCEKCGKWATDDRSRDSDGVSGCEMCGAYRKAGCVRCDKCGSIVDGTGVSPTQVDELRAGSLPAAPVPIVTPERMLLLEHHCSEADFATIGKLRDESYAAGYSAGRDAAARLNVKQVSHVVELGSETLRTLVAAIIGAGGKDWHVVEDAIDATDHLLTHLCEKEKTR